MNNLENSKQNLLQKSLERFIFLYVILYIFPYGFEYISELTTDDISFWEPITIWFGETFMGWEFNKQYLSKGFDSKYDHSRFFLITILSIIGSILWAIIDGKIKVNYKFKLKTLLKTILRYHVGLTLILYGMSKVLMIQFGDMDLNNLEKKVGDYVGMGFLWTFMSYSKFFTISVGLVEVIGGVFLLFRRTWFVGAFISFIAMTNVVLMDAGFNVSVKMFAVHLFLMTIILLSDQIKRIYSFFIANKPINSLVNEPLFLTGKKKKVGYFMKVSILLYFVISQTLKFTELIDTYRTKEYSYMTAFHKVDLMLINGDTIPKSISVKNRWESMAINGVSYLPDVIAIKQFHNKRDSYYTFKADTIKKTIEFYPYKGDEKDLYQFSYEKLADKKYLFKGTHQGDSILIKTKAKMLKDYTLISDETKWILRWD